MERIVSTAVGIDLGTSNSVVAIIKDGEPVVLADKEGRKVQPSVIAFGYGATVVVGQRARQQMSYSPENTVYSSKRLIGRRFNSSEVERMRNEVPWGITEGPHGDARIRVQGKVFSVPEVSAHVLRHMKKLAEEATGEEVSHAVITVPAYFNDQQRQATRDAAAIAGLNCLRIVNEPTAAALAYNMGAVRQQNIAVYDLGGGTFDMSILRVEADVLEVVSTAGDTFLGGDDFDTTIAAHLQGLLEASSGVSVVGNLSAMAKLREAAERAKVALSEAEVTEVRVPGLARDAQGQTVHLRQELDRAAVDKLVMPLIQRTFLVVDDALAQAGLTAGQIDQVLLVGGMTRFPSVREAVGAYFQKSPIDRINPDEVVAIGAALQAWNLTRVAEQPASLLLDVTPLSLGVRTVGGFVDPIIPRNSGIPTDATKVFHTAHDSQTEVRIQVYQGESKLAADNELLGEFVLDGLRPAPRGEARIRVSFAIDADGIVKVTAEDVQTGRERELRIEASSGLTRDEVQQMRFDDLSF
jgi:molecular chaperone DnaK